MTFSLKHLLFALIVANLGMAALTTADLPLVAESFDMLAFAIIVLVGYAAWASEGEDRAFRIGFAAWGGLYFLGIKFWHVQFNLASYKLLQLGWTALMPKRIADLRGTGEPFIHAETNWMNRFEAVGQSLFALLFGLIGGCVTVYFFRKRQQMLRRREQQTT